MPGIRVEVDDRKLVARFGDMLPNVREALVEAFAPLAQSMAADARARAAAHIRFLGKKPGFYLASIYGGTFENDSLVGGFVRSGNPVAHLLEDGATVPPHDILPKAGDVLAFDGDAGRVFAMAVHSPGAEIPAYPAIEPALGAARADVEAAIRSAVRKGGR